MAYHITHRYGAMESNPPLVSLVGLLAELNDSADDTEHGSVAVTHESEWCLEVSRNGYITLENLDEGEPRHMRNVSPAKIIQLWELLSQGDIASIENEEWILGY